MTPSHLRIASGVGERPAGQIRRARGLGPLALAGALALLPRSDSPAFAEA